MNWVPAVEGRHQLVMFERKLDDALPKDHVVRQFALLMDQLDWSRWESEYAQWGPGRTAIHPKVMASVILYGMLTRVRASRQLEEALVIRIDFRWLAEGRHIDHSTICNFRQSKRERLQELFVQLGLLAQSAGILKLSELAFDGTKIRANNSCSKKLKTADLQHLHDELTKKFSEQAAEIEKLDASAGEDDGDDGNPEGGVSQKLEDIQSRLEAVKRAMAAVKHLEREGKTVPKRLPLTDMESRITPSKEGGFAPNYTPGVMVDTESGLIVAADVIADTNEKAMLPAALATVKEAFSCKPQRILADTIFSHGSNLAVLESEGIDLYSPVADTADNPALRADPTQSVPAEQLDKLPVKKTRGRQQFSKQAFVFAAKHDAYYCPAGNRLEYKSTSTSKTVDGTEVKTRRYLSNRQDCQACSLRERCIAGTAKYRHVQRDQFEELRDQLRERMHTPQGQAIYARRIGPGERPFAMTKRIMGVRQFATRGLQKVKREWLWLTAACNIKLLLKLLRSRAGPLAPPAPCPQPDHNTLQLNSLVPVAP